MPVLIPIIAAVAGAAVAAGTAAVIGGTIGLIVGAAVGALVAIGVSYAGQAIAGNPNGKTQAAQDRKQMFRSGIAPRQIVYGPVRVSGPMVYASSSGSDQRYLHVVIPVASHAVAGWDAVWINDLVIRPDELDELGIARSASVGQSGWIRVKFHNGTQTEADPDLVAESPDGWSAEHVGHGIAYVYVRLEYNLDLFRSGLQNVSVEIRGKSDIYDPRTGITQYTANPALCLLAYLRSDLGLACEDDEIDFPSFITAANVCDEAVQVAEDGTTQARYHVAGVVVLDRTPLEIIEDLKAPMGGELVYVQGKYRLYAAAYSAPTDTLTVSDLAGPVELLTMPPRRELFNAVRGTYIEPSRSFQASEFAPQVEASFVEADGETIWQDIELPFVNDHIRAQRLARLLLMRARESLTLRAPVRYAGIRYAVWQMLSVTIADFGWTNKPFRITAWTFDPQSGIITLTLREEGAASYAWTYDQARELGAAPNTSLVSPWVIAAPGGLTLTEDLYVARDGGGVRSRAVLTWLPPPHPFVTGYDVEYREAAATGWTAGTGSAGSARSVIDDIARGLYVFRVRARSSVTVGAWTELQARIWAASPTPPADVTGLALQSIGGLAFLRWTQHPAIDVRFGGRIEIRHTPDTVSPTWVGSTSIGLAMPGDATIALLPLKAGTYLVKAVDASGRYSTSPAFIKATQATALPFAVVDTLTEHPAFAGTLTDTLVIGDVLRLDGGGDIDDEADWDAIADLDLLGGIIREGSYAFSGGLDLGSVKSVRLTGRILAEVVNTYDQIDARAETVDAWLDWDGAVGGEADAWIEVRETDDAPGGTPTWSDWRRLDASEFTARGFEFRAQLRSNDLAFNIHVSELSVTADEVA